MSLLTFILFSFLTLSLSSNRDNDRDNHDRNNDIDNIRESLLRQFPYNIKGEVLIEPGYWSSFTNDIGFYLQNYKTGIYIHVTNDLASKITGVSRGNLVEIEGIIGGRLENSASNQPALYLTQESIVSILAAEPNNTVTPREIDDFRRLKCNGQLVEAKGRITNITDLSPFGIQFLLEDCKENTINIFYGFNENDNTLEDILDILEYDENEENNYVNITGICECFDPELDKDCLHVILPRDQNDIISSDRNCTQELIDDRQRDDRDRDSDRNFRREDRERDNNDDDDEEDA